MPCSKHERNPQSAPAMPDAATQSSILDRVEPVAVASPGAAIRGVPSLDAAARSLERDDSEAMQCDFPTTLRHSLTNQLVEEHFDRVYRYAYYLAGCANVAEDIAQEVFLRAFRAIHQLRSHQACVGWLLTIARNEFGRYCQTRKMAQGIEFEEIIEHSDHVRQMESQDWVQHAISQLPVEFRTVVLMFYFEEKSYSQIAVELELPMGTVMSRLNRARQHLKLALDPQTHAQLVKPVASNLKKDLSR